MKVLITGAFGMVGRSVLDAVLKNGHSVRVLESGTRKNRRTARKYRGAADIRYGDIRNIADVGEAVAGMDAVIHLAAVIPPIADRRPRYAGYINIGGTKNLIDACASQPRPLKFLYTSSVAVYGDRVVNPHIRACDPLRPNDDDEYAKQKIRCEQLLSASGLDWTVFRLTYIVSASKLKMDPLMFSMPLDTSLEVCHSKDIGTALANALTVYGIGGKVFHLAGGERCRTSFRQYLDTMMRFFGLGPLQDVLPPSAFDTHGFHCGFMDTAESEALFRYQKHSLNDYFAEVKKRYRVKRFFIRLVRPIARSIILKRSPHYSAEKKQGRGAERFLMGLKRKKLV